MQNSEVRVAMLGFGGIAKSHKYAYEKLKQRGEPVKLVAVCDIDSEQFKKAQKINLGGNLRYDFSAQNIYTNIDEMLAKEEIDMVDICLPSYLHKDYTIKMLNAGVHVLCEKPMALSSADCGEMIEAAHKNNKLLMVGQCLRYDPLYLFIKQTVEDGSLGCVKNAYFERLSSMPRWGYDGWYHDTERSGGAIMDLHIHDVDMVRFLFGEPSAVSAISYDTETRWTVINSRFMYDDNRIIIADASWDEAASTKFSMSYRIRFELATVKLERGKVTVYPDEGEPYMPELPKKNRMEEEILALVRSISEGYENKANPPKSAMMSVKIVQTLRESADAGGKPVMFNS